MRIINSILASLDRITSSRSREYVPTRSSAASTRRRQFAARTLCRWSASGSVSTRPISTARWCPHRTQRRRQPGQRDFGSSCPPRALRGRADPHRGAAEHFTFMINRPKGHADRGRPGVFAPCTRAGNTLRRLSRLMFLTVVWLGGRHAPPRQHAVRGHTSTASGFQSVLRLSWHSVCQMRRPHDSATLRVIVRREDRVVSGTTRSVPAIDAAA